MIRYAPTTLRNDIPEDTGKILSSLTEETMFHAWGERTLRERHGIVTAAVVFGEEFERRVSELPPDANEERVQRFLMSLMSAAVEEFARREEIPPDEAAAFLSEVGTRDRVLEFNEVLGVWAERPESSLDDLLREAVEARQDKSIWARHFKSG